MLELLAAAAIAAQSAPPAGDLPRAPLVVRERKVCGLWHSTPTAQPSNAPAQLKKLKDLPPANHEIAVLRLDPNGCPAPVIVRYDVQGDGRFAGGR